MQLSLQTVLTFEFVVPCIMALAFLVGHVPNKRFLKWVIFALSVTQIVVVSLRPVEYNSDTWAYYNYVSALSDATGSEFFLLTKFEPLHLLLAAIAQDFRYWLFLEGVVAIGLLWTLIWRSQRLETLAAVIGTSLPLMSSSLRFAIGLLAVACTLSIYRRRRWRFLVLTFVGAITHVSLAVAGILQRRRWVTTWALLIAFCAVTTVVSSILVRAGVTEGGDVRPAGIRSSACLVGLILYLRWCLRDYRRGFFYSDILSALGIFVLSLLFFPVINRWTILLLVIVAVEADAALDAARVPRRTGRIAALLLYGALVVPVLYTVSKEVSAGERFVMLQTDPNIREPAQLTAISPVRRPVY